MTSVFVMDTIRFFAVAVPRWVSPVVDIGINGRRLIEMLHEWELPFAQRQGSPQIAGGYVGLDAREVLPPSRHFFGQPEPKWHDDCDRVPILACGGCGEVGCWPMVISIRLSTDTVTWEDFRQPHRGPSSAGGHWSYDGFGPFTFDRDQYEAALLDAV